MASTTTPSAEVSEGPALSIINKRLRALRKKQNRITQMEESVSQGKTLNREQQETLSSKPFLLGAIEELERLRQIIPPQEPTQSEPIQPTGSDLVLEDLLKLVYFGSMFDVKTQGELVGMMYRKTHERGCCLTYDYVTEDDSQGDLLGEGDLDSISMLGGLLVSRPVDSGLSHKEALRSCVHHAKMWLSNSDQPVVDGSNVTYAALREKLNKIMASDYFTTTPEMKASDEMAAAAENYKSFHVPLNGSVLPKEVDDSTMNHEHKEQDGNFNKPDSYDGQFGHVEELHKDASEVGNSIEINVEVESNQQSNEMQNSHELDYKEQLDAPRRQHRGGRGGGYKGYHNGRGGRGRGGYQNGHSQNYEQTEKYYPRYNNNYRGRGGRGGAGGYYNHSAEVARVPVDS